MINLGSVLGAVASGMLLGGRSNRHGRGFGISTARGAMGLGNLLGACYGNETERFKKWNSQQRSASAIDQDLVHKTINKGAWYDLKPGENAATTSSLGPGIIEINKDAVAPPPLPVEEIPMHEQDAPPPLPVDDGPEPIPPSGARQVDRSVSAFEFLEVPEEEIADSLGIKALRIIIAAAHADGVLHEKERDLVEGQLDDLSPEEAQMAKKEMANPQSIEEITAGIETLEDRKFIFGLAAMTLRADGKVTSEENQFIRDLARELKLDKTTAMEIIKASKP